MQIASFDGVWDRFIKKKKRKKYKLSSGDNVTSASKTKSMYHIYRHKYDIGLSIRHFSNSEVKLQHEIVPTINTVYI